jgi:hypothetical protein
MDLYLDGFEVRPADARKIPAFVGGRKIAPERPEKATKT